MAPKLTDLASERKKQLLDITRDAIGKERAGFGTDKSLEKETIPLGIPEIDKILGGGFRKGRIAIVVGNESMGKTLLTQWTIKAFQEHGEICGFIDPEKTYEGAWFATTGVNIDDLIVAQPASTEQAFDLACLWSKNDVGLIVIDSLAALTPKARADSSLEKQEFRALAPRKIGEGMNKFVGENVNSLLMCTNQVRIDLGILYGNPKSMPGGRALRHYTSYMLEVSRSGWLVEQDRKVGYNMKIEATKNKLTEPYQVANVPFLFTTGSIDTVGGTIALALELSLIPQKGSWFKWEEQMYQGRQALADMFRAKPDQFELLQRMVESAE